MREFLLPFLAQVGVRFLVPRTAAMLQTCEAAAEVFAHPLAHLRTQPLVTICGFHNHRSQVPSNSAAAARSRIASALPSQ
jgi:hypothetical protein